MGCLWLQRTSDAVSAHGEMHMSISLIAFLSFMAVFSGLAMYMMKLIRKGIAEDAAHGH